MKNQFLDQRIFNRIEVSLQKLMELNMKTLQNLSYLKPEEYSKLQKPEEIFEKHVNIFIQNGHKALDHMKDTFGILEHHWFDIAQNFEESSIKTIKKTQATAKNSLKRSASALKSSLKTKPPKAKATLKKETKISPASGPGAKKVSAASAKSKVKKASSNLKAKIKPKAEKKSAVNPDKFSIKGVGLNINKDTFSPTKAPQ